jgi:hypothetical protein
MNSSSLLAASHQKEVVMPTTLNEIHEMLDNKGIGNEIDADDCYVRTGSATDVYRDSDDEKGISIVIVSDENGEFVRIIAPNLYFNKNSEHELAVLQTCVQVSQCTKMIKCHCDEADGEIRMEIEIPLEDNSLSQKQLMRALSCIVETVEKFDECFRSAIEDGKATVAMVLGKRKKQARLASLIHEASEVDVEQLIRQLEFANEASTAKEKSQHALH